MRDDTYSAARTRSPRTSDFVHQEAALWRARRDMVERSSKGQALTAQELSVKRLLEGFKIPFEEKFLLESPVEQRFYVIDFHITMPPKSPIRWLLECTWTSRKYPSACADWLRKRAVLFDHKFWRAKQQAPFVTAALLEAQWLSPQDIRTALSPLQHTDLVFCSLTELYLTLIHHLAVVRTSAPAGAPFEPPDSLAELEQRQNRHALVDSRDSK